eukprot:TRINITY_DN13561_c0_g2_i1.p1 TRINITY_DN13561_c0_g2~~TRINITY_DN13561_c0_g2_i1.p1  ORF type:complete len:354 (+),score=76.99 TRINITY_DN13561_c0_g2_i1:108-1169(+)
MIRRPPRSTLSSSSAASDVYKRQVVELAGGRAENCLSWARLCIKAAAVLGGIHPAELCGAIGMKAQDLHALLVLDIVLNLAFMVRLVSGRSQLFLRSQALVGAVLFGFQESPDTSSLHLAVAGEAARSNAVGGVWDLVHHLWEAGSWDELARQLLELSVLHTVLQDGTMPVLLQVLTSLQPRVAAEVGSEIGEWTRWVHERMWGCPRDTGLAQMVSMAMSSTSPPRLQVGGWRDFLHGRARVALLLQGPSAPCEGPWAQSLANGQVAVDRTNSVLFHSGNQVTSCWHLASGTQLVSRTTVGAPDPLSATSCAGAVSYTHLRAHETPEHLVCRLLLEKKKKPTSKNAYNKHSTY